MHRGDLGVLSGDDRQTFLDGRTHPVVLQGGDDPAGDAVERGEDRVQLGAVGVGGGEQVLHPLLSGLLGPAQGGGLLDVQLPGGHVQRAVVEVGLQGVHRPLPEEVRVVVVQRTGEQLDVERSLGLTLAAVLVQQAEAHQHRGSLRHTHLVVVESDVEVDVLVVPDQAVVGDHRDVGCCGGVQLAGQCGAVDRGDDQQVGSAGDHLVDLAGLRGDVVVGELQVHVVAGLLQTGLHGLTVGDPAFRGLGRHRHTDEDVLRRLALTGLLVAAASRTFACACGQGEHSRHAERNDRVLAHPGLLRSVVHYGPPRETAVLVVPLRTIAGHPERAATTVLEFETRSQGGRQCSVVTIRSRRRSATLAEYASLLFQWWERSHHRVDAGRSRHR